MASTELAQLDSWLDIAALLQSALIMPEAADWRIVLEYDLLRLDKRIDAIIVTPRAIFVLEFKRGARGSPWPTADRPMITRRICGISTPPRAATLWCPSSWPQMRLMWPGCRR